MNHDDESESRNAFRQATRHKAPSELHGRIAASLRQTSPLLVAPPSRSFWASSQHQWMRMGVAFACGVVASLTFTLFYAAPVQEDRLSQEVVAGHVRSLMAAHLADVVSSDQHMVKPWFSGKLDFSPPVHDLTKDGFPLVGGRLDYLDQRPVAALIYRRQQHTINLFVWPSSRSSQHDLKLQSHQGFNMIDWSESGMQFWAVSDLNAAELQTFTRLLAHEFDNYQNNH